MKAILVIDMPMKCFDCKLYCNNGNSYWCIATNEDTTGLTKPINCPLKPVPKKKEIEKYDTWYEMFRAEAFNDIIDELIGDEE